MQDAYDKAELMLLLDEGEARPQRSITPELIMKYGPSVTKRRRNKVIEFTTTAF